MPIVATADLQEYFKGWFIGQMLGQVFPTENSLPMQRVRKLFSSLHAVFTTIQTKVNNSRSLYFQNQLYRKFALDKTLRQNTILKNLPKR
jgi:hypothetical protein